MRRFSEITLTLEAKFWLMLCSREDLVLNTLYLKMLTVIKQQHIRTWFRKYRLKHRFHAITLKQDKNQISCGASLGRGHKSLHKLYMSHHQDGRNAHMICSIGDSSSTKFV